MTVDPELYELMRHGWVSPYPDPEGTGTEPAKLASPGVYQGELLASLGPVIAALTGQSAVEQARVDEVCSLCGNEPDESGEVSPVSCKLKSPLPPDCSNTYRCYALFEAQVDECDPEWFGCPRTVGVFCLNPENTTPNMPVDSWFIMEDPSWLTGGVDTVAWYLIEIPAMPGTTRICSPQGTNLPPGDQLAGAPSCNYAPCSFQDLIDLREMCKLDTDGDGVIEWKGLEIVLPEGFCQNITDIINKIENPGKYLGSPMDDDGNPMHTPLNIGVCVSQWTYTWDPCLETHLPNGAKCPYKGGWGPPKLVGLQCISTLSWTLLSMMLSPQGELGHIPGPPEDPDNDCTRVFYIRHFRCNNIGEACRINSHIRRLPPNPDGSDRCVCPRGDGTYYECPCDTPGAQPGGWDPCDPANGYVPKAKTENCEGGGIPIDDPAGGTGGAGIPKPDGGISHEPPPNPIVVPLGWGRVPEKPLGCTQFPCELQCTTCKGALITGMDYPGAPGAWSVIMNYHACEENLCGWEKSHREHCQVSGPCTTQQKKTHRTKSCDPTVPPALIDPAKNCNDIAPDFPGTTAPDFYNTCPVCKGYAEGTWQCRGNPQVLTRGPWTIKFECKTLDAWKKFFDEVHCNQWRALRWSSCELWGCSSRECGVTWIEPKPDDDGKVNKSRDCPPDDLITQRSGDDPTTTTIGYTPKYNPCSGTIMARVRNPQGQWTGWSAPGGTVPCHPLSGIQTNPGSCDPVTGKSLNCAAGTKYSISYDYVYGTVCTPHKHVTTYGCSSPGRDSNGAATCRYKYTVHTVTVGSGPCAREYLNGGYSGYGPVLCGNPGFPSFIGCAWASTSSSTDSSQCSHIEIKVLCHDGRSIGCGGGSLCDDSLQQKRVSCIKVEYTRNDCKTPNPTAT